MTCIVCPKGCQIRVEGEQISGYGCKRGLEYATNELREPRRMLTSTVRLKGGAIARLPVRSSAPFLKAQMIDAIAELNSVVVSVPISIGDVVLQNVLGTNIDFIATKSED